MVIVTISFYDSGKDEVIDNPTTYGMLSGEIVLLAKGAGDHEIANADTAYKYYIITYYSSEYQNNACRVGDTFDHVSCKGGGYGSMELGVYGTELFVLTVTDATMTRNYARLTWTGNTAHIEGGTSGWGTPLLFGIR